MITPNTNIRLLNVPLAIDNKNQLTFANKTAQMNYFNSLDCIVLEDTTYQRKDAVLRYPAIIDNIYGYNYCMYQNDNYSDKWFFAFITNMKYVNDYMTEISIQIDVWQTWQFDLEFNQSFVEREMVSVVDDIQGKNLLDEGLELGEIVINSTIEDNNLEPYYVIAYSGDYIDYDGTRTQIPQSGALINGIPTAISYIFCSGGSTFMAMIKIINDSGMGDKIFTCFTIPKLAFEENYQPFTLNSTIETNLPCCIISQGSYPSNEKEITITKNTSIDGYTPRNKKLLNYPYNYIGFTALNGEKKLYRFENFTDEVKFKVSSEVNPNPSILYRPVNYRKSFNGLNDVAVLNGYPTLAYKNDYYNTWLAQNSNIIKLSMTQEEFNYDVSQIKEGLNGAGAVIGSLSDGLLSGVPQALSSGINMGSNNINHEIYQRMQMAQKQKQALLPDTINLGSSATALGYDLLDLNVFTIYSIKSEFAQRIDKFFDMYGYMVNTVKVPSINNRPNWNYIKTIGLNVIGNIPQEDQAIIKSIFNNGVTLWHNPNTFLDYSQNNR